MSTKAEISNENMIELWIFMGDLYGAAFTSQYGNKAREWKAHLTYLRLTPAHIEYGKEKCRQQRETMPPNLSTFTRFCRPSAEDLGLPSEDEAYKVAAHLVGYLYSSHETVPSEKWKHPIVWHAAQRVGFFEINRQPESKSKPSFFCEYRKLISSWVAGERYFIPDPIERRLPPPPKVSEEEISKSREQLKNILGREPNWSPS